MQSVISRPDLEQRRRLLDAHVHRQTDVLQPVGVLHQLGRAAQERVVDVEAANVEVQRLAKLQRGLELGVSR